MNSVLNNDYFNISCFIPNFSNFFNSANNFIGFVLGLESENDGVKGDANFKQE